MNNDTQQNQENEESEMQYYKQMLHSQIDNLNDLSMLRVIAHFILKHSFDKRKD